MSVIGGGRQRLPDMEPYPTNPVTGEYREAGDVAGVPEYTIEPATPRAPPVRAAWETKIDSPRWAFYAGLAGGVLILFAAFLGALFFTAIAAFDGTIPGWAWWAGPRDGVVGDDGFPQVPLMIAIWGLVTGIAVLLCALRVKERPDEAAIPGVIMLVAGLLSFLALGGFLLGGILAITGGVLAIAGSSAIWHARGPRMRERGIGR